jgi:uncharacterized protein
LNEAVLGPVALWNGRQIPIFALSEVDVEEDRMTPEERRLIEDLFDRMMSYGSPEKDREADSLIKERLRAMPDAAYMLTQSVLVQEQALQAANERVAELEDRVRALQERQDGPPRRSGSFLGSVFTNRDRDDRAGLEGRPSSVPQVGARAPAPPYERPSAWGQSERPSAPWQSAPPQQPPQPPPAGSGGGFMRSAMATAAGVAGGVLVADSIRNMMGGGHAKAAAAGGKDEHQNQLADSSSSSHDEQGRHDDQSQREDQGQHDDQGQGDDQGSRDDQGEYDTAEDDNYDGGSDFGDDSIDV